MIRFGAIFTLLYLACLWNPAHGQEKFYNYYDRGLKFMEKNDFARALTEFTSAISLEYEDAKNKRTYGTRFIEYYPHREMGVCHFNLGDVESAKKELELSLAFNSSKRANEYLGKCGGDALTSYYQRKKEEDEKKKLEMEEKLNLKLQDKIREEQVIAEMEKNLELQKGQMDEKKLQKEKQLEEDEKRLAEDKAKAKSKEEQKRLEEEEKRIKNEKEKLIKERQMLVTLKTSQEKDYQDKQKEIEDQRKKLQAEKDRLDREKQKIMEMKAAKSREGGLPSGALTYDPAKVTQVGSRLAIGVLPFSRYGQAGNISESITDKMITQLVNLKRFRVIERSAIDKVIKEQDFGMSDMVDLQAAAKVGKLAGADAIVIGSINIEPGFAKVSARVVDTETAETMVAKEEKSGNTTQNVIEMLVEDLTVSIYNDMPLVEGFIVSVEADMIYLDIGSRVGLRKGSKVVAYREGDIIRHPISKEVIGKKNLPLGELVVLEVQDKLSVCKFVGKVEQSARVGDKVVVK